MINRSTALALAIAAALGLAPLCQADAANPFTHHEAQLHAEQAFKVAGEDLRAEAEHMCRAPSAGPSRPAEGARDQPIVVFEPKQIFDNLYYFGSSFVGATVLKTSAGLILIDTLSSDDDVAQQLVAGMKSMGLDPAQIHYVIITHGHGDHYGGARYLREHFPGLRLIMSQADWEYTRKPIRLPSGQIDPAPKPPRGAGDIGFTGSYRLVLGDTTISLIETPGHTPGTVSLLYPIKQAGRRYMVMQWGGGDPLSARVSVEAVERYVDAAKQAEVAVRWGSHPRPDWRELVSRVHPSSTDPGPLVEGRDKMARYLQVLVSCKLAIQAEGSAP